MARHKAGHTAHGVEEGGINCSSRTWGTSGEVGAGSTPKPPMAESTQAHCLWMVLAFHKGGIDPFKRCLNQIRSRIEPNGPRCDTAPRSPVPSATHLDAIDLLEDLALLPVAAGSAAELLQHGREHPAGHAGAEGIRAIDELPGEGKRVEWMGRNPPPSPVQP